MINYIQSTSRACCACSVALFRIFFNCLIVGFVWFLIVRSFNRQRLATSDSVMRSMYLSLINSRSSSLNESNSSVIAFNTKRCGVSWFVLFILSVHDFIAPVRYNLILNSSSFIIQSFQTKKHPHV